MSPNPPSQLWCMTQLSLQRNQISLQRYLMSLQIVFMLNLNNAKKNLLIINTILHVWVFLFCFFTFFTVLISILNQYYIHVNLQYTSLYIIVQPLFYANIGQAK